jgi:hypothetical protein
MPNHKLSQNVYLENNPFGSSADHDVADRPYRINTYDDNCRSLDVSWHRPALANRHIRLVTATGHSRSQCCRGLRNCKRPQM